MPETDAERNAIREQLERILGNPLFKNSKRYPNMLRFVVERALSGHIEHLKERTLGVEVFGRDPDYDTNLDPVVRITAGEIRKRIAQYYHEGGHQTEIRIDFPPGSYLPEFRMPPAPPVEVALPPAPALPRPRIPVLPVGIGLLGIAILALLIARPWSMPNALDRFWGPVLSTTEPLVLYIGGYPTEAAPNPAVSLMELQNSERVAFSDATALARVTSLLVTRKKPFRIRFQVSSRLDDLREAPAILIGAFNNSWTLRLTNQLRFGFNRDQQTHESWIEDHINPGSRQWIHQMNAPYADVKEDYAIVSRVWDPTTGKVVVTVAGLAKYGTAAAGEFLTDASAMEEINQKAPRAWDRKNIEIVISTSVLGRSSGPSHIVAVHAW